MVFIITQATLIAGRVRVRYQNVWIVLFKFTFTVSSCVDKTLFSTVCHTCFDIILREVKTFECYNIIGFIQFEDTLVLLFKRMITNLVLAPLFFSPGLVD